MNSYHYIDKRQLIGFFAVLLLFFAGASPVRAHTLYMNLVDNEDGTVLVEAMFSTGGSGAGLPLILEDEDQQVIAKMKLDENGEATFEIPDQPYTVFLDGGPGHRVRKPGPEKPK